MAVRRFALFALLLGLSTLPLRADEVSDKQKAVALQNLKTAGLAKMTAVESANFIVCSLLPDAKAKALAESLEKLQVTAKKALQFEANDQPWKGKLTVYLFEDQRPMRLFMLQIMKERVQDPYMISIRSDEPFVAKPLDTGKKWTDAELNAEVGKLVAAALLGAKAGSTATMPDWVRFGFGRAAVARSAGQGSKLLLDLKSKARAAAVTARPVAMAEDAWNTTNEVVDASVMDYFAFGPGTMHLPKLLTALRPAENGDIPSMDMVLLTLMVTKDDLDKAWKKHVQSGK